jgi:hypothetical protein
MFRPYRPCSGTYPEELDATVVFLIKVSFVSRVLARLYSHRISPGARIFRQILVTITTVVHVDGVRIVSELPPPTGILFIPQMICEYGEPRLNFTDKGNRRTQRKTCPRVNLPLMLRGHIF